MSKLKIYTLILIVIFVFCFGTKSVLAQDSQSVLYVPLIGISSVPEPLALPNGPGNVTYHYAVKNFIRESALTDIKVTDDKCSSVKFVEGDDNNDGKLDYSETWRYSCTTKLSITTESTATATGAINTLTATQKAYATVVVGSNNPPPLVNIVNVTKISYPLFLPKEGGDIVFTYKVNNPGVVPLSDVSIADDKCSAMSNKLGDTNYNNLLDVDEVWIYTCVAHLNQTTTNTARVTAFANGLMAVGETTLTVLVDTSSVESPPLFDVSISPAVGVNPNFKITTWKILSGILAALIIIFFIFKSKKR